MMPIAALPQPGYVYVLENPALAGWHKVGQTYRPPHRRAQELSKTALPVAFETAYARFFWDAPRAERAIHRHLTEHWHATRRREFFRVPLPHLRATVESWKDVDHRPALFGEPWAMETEDAGQRWAVSREGLEARWEWAEADAQSLDPDRRRRGWQAMHRLSSNGWDEASWRLGMAIFQAQPGPQSAERAAWVFEAMQAQGGQGGRLRAAWLRSWQGPDAFQRWLETLADEWRATGQGKDPINWPEHVQETLQLERHAWVQHPQRQTASPWWQAWPDWA